MTVIVYSVIAEREGRWWTIKIPSIEGVTQAKRLSEVKQMAIDLIAVTKDIAPSSIVVELHFSAVGDTQVEEHLAQVLELRALAESYERKAAEETKVLAKSLVAQDVPLRDIGEILGISHQRVHQIIKT